MGHSRNSSLFENQLAMPWQGALIVSVIVYAGLRWGSPLLTSHEFTWQEGFVQGFHNVAPLVSFALFFRLL